MGAQLFCRNHPEREAAALCQKYGHGLCADCLDQDPRCSDPDIYCKFRPQCIISFREKESRRRRIQSGGKA